MEGRSRHHWSAHGLHVDLLMEVLSWLPGKSLMRFKSVSTQWFSLTTNPVFVEMHHTRSYTREAGVFLVQYTSSTCYGIYGSFLMMDWTRTDPMIRWSTHKPSLSHTTGSHSNIVNGLICFYHRQDPEGCIYIYNFTTRENLPVSSPQASYMNTSIERRCHLGFDPVNKVYKVLQVWWPFKKNTLDIQCEVFTLGGSENNWRPINISPADRIACIYYSTRFCNDGFLYWNRDLEPKRTIVTFNVEHEKFDFINYPQEVPASHDVVLYITQLQGHLSVVAISDKTQCAGVYVTLWRLTDRKDNHWPVWTKEVIMLPFHNVKKALVGFSRFGLVSLVRGSPIPNQVIIDCYMLDTGKHKELIVNNLSEGTLYPGARFCPSKLVENIMPLKISNGSVC